jgi:protein-S-isoprenylcysteine O-methyltransferase Ste14
MMFRMIFRSVLGVILLMLVLFAPAGTMAWPEAWIFLALFIGCSVATGIWLKVTDPDLLAARMKSPLSADQRPRDRIVIAAIMLVFWGWFVVMALDARRFEWSHVPLWIEVLGALMVIGAFYGWITVLRANRFAATNVRVQRERGQTVVSTGPYAVVRHPMYAYAVLLIVGTALLLGSLWGGLLGVILLVPLFGVRAVGEEAVLLDGLAGYRDYTAKVRYRLIPGVW